jgi:Ser/Thr protein kinase RdoA (MazF antagonist)
VVLSFVDGEPAGGRPPAAGDDVVHALGALVRRMHDAQAGFRAPPDARWQALPRSPEGDDVICHNDVLGQNVVFRDALPVALIDWELAAPGPPLADLCVPAWFWVPLRPDADAARHGFPTERRGARLRLLLDGYGAAASECRSFLDLFTRVWRSWQAAFRLWGGRERRAGWADAFDAGRCDVIEENLRWLDASRGTLEEALG